MFFDSCDGFFTNYNWTEENLVEMKNYSGLQGREADVYVGVDVFARGNVVGGMLETNKVEETPRTNVPSYKYTVILQYVCVGISSVPQALDVIRKHDFSAAIFAPGWVYESNDDKTEFRQNQDM